MDTHVEFDVDFQHGPSLHHILEVDDTSRQICEPPEYTNHAPGKRPPGLNDILCTTNCGNYPSKSFSYTWVMLYDIC